MTTDYCGDRGCPEPSLRQIAEHGFSRVHWCHHWNSDFLYGEAEIRQIGRWLRDFKLELNDLHASHGAEKCWVSAREYERRAGVELVHNRLQMTAQLGADVIVLHTNSEPEAPAERETFWCSLRRSLDELQPRSRQTGVRIALENGQTGILDRLLADYPADFLGLCYDSGHGNLGDGQGLDWLDRHQDRLLAIHLHDNHGQADEHDIIFSGTVDWPRLAGILAASSYGKCLNHESNVRRNGLAGGEFLARSYQAGERLQQLVDAARGQANR